MLQSNDLTMELLFLDIFLQAQGALELPQTLSKKLFLFYLTPL